MYIGIDIIEADRFKGMEIEQLRRLFTEREVEYFDKKNFAVETVAGLYCAKEAFFKALGTGMTQNSFREVEILHTVNGAPYYRFTSELVQVHDMLSTARIQVSISNTKNLSVAVCVIVPSSILI